MHITDNVKSLRDSGLQTSNSSFNVHDHLKTLTVEELQALSITDRLPWHTACLNVTGDLNVGTMIRTSHCMGASSVVIFGRQKIDNRSLVGSANYITVHKVAGIETDLSLNASEFVAAMDRLALTPVFVEMGGLALSSINWSTRLEAINNRNQQICLVMGNETGGIPDDILSLQNLIPNSFSVSIPQRGVIRSMNVAIAHAMVVNSLCTSMRWI
jgi:tRNA G18 (ribose-2'-O)-methylase SpoU